MRDQEVLLFNVDELNLDTLYDDYTEPKDSVFNDGHIASVVENQRVYVEEKKEALRQIANNRLHYLNTDFERAHLRDYIKMNSPEIVALENFSTRVSKKGILLENITDNPFEHNVS